jgi:uncharacterized protein
MTSAEPERGRVSRGWIYRQLRLWHGYLSALAFVALILFSVTGILLNHPQDPASAGGAAIKPQTSVLKLAPDELKRVRGAKSPPRELAGVVGGRAHLVGAFMDGEASGSDVFVRLQGVRGTSDLVGHLDTGEVEVTVEEAGALAVLNELHRGERASPAWRFAIDAIAVTLIVMSVLGYLIFLTLRFRLMTALALTGLSAAVLVALFLFAVS